MHKQMNKYIFENRMLDTSDYHNHDSDERLSPRDQEWKLWTLNNDIRMFKSTDTTDGSIMFKFNFEVEMQISFIQKILTNIEEYAKWLSPFHKAKEVATVSTEDSLPNCCSPQCIIAEAQVDIIKTAIDKYNLCSDFISTYFHNWFSVPIKFIVYQKENGNKENKKVVTSIKTTKQKGLATKLIPGFSIEIICESFASTNIVYVNLLACVSNNLHGCLIAHDAKLRQCNVINSNSAQSQCNQPNSIIVEEIIKSFSNLKTYIKEYGFGDCRAQIAKIQYYNFAKSPEKTDSIKEKEVRLATYDQGDNFKLENESFDEMDSADTFEIENTTGLTIDKIPESVMKMRKSVFNYDKKLNQTEEIQRKLSDNEEICVEETKGKTSDQEDIVSKCYIDGEWTKWVVERCTPEEKDIFDEFKQRLEKYLSENNPRALKEEVTDNLILRFIAANDFQNPEESFITLLEYIDYIEKYDYQSLTKEYIIDLAPEEIKCIFDLNLHTIVGGDRIGRPIVIFKVRNIDKEVFANIEISRLYMLYQLKTIRSRFPAYVDKMITIYDFEGSGFKNLAIGMFQTLNPELSRMFPHMSYMNIIVHPNWILKVAWGLAKNFLSEYQKKKIKVFYDHELLDELLKLADLNSIPEEYGGNFVS